MGADMPISTSLLPWLTLISIIWLQAINSTNSDFSAYSSQLKSCLDITQVQLNYLAVAADAGKLFGWISGMAANHLPLPFVALIGGLIGLVGYGIPYLFLSDVITGFSYRDAVVLSVLAGNSICWVNTACYVASMRAFPSNHGTVVALSTSYSALTAKIDIALAQLLLGKTHAHDQSVYLLLNAVAPLSVGIITAVFLRDPKQTSVMDTREGFIALFVIAGATGAYSIVASVVPVIARMSIVPQVILLAMVASVTGVPLAKAGVWLLGRRCRRLRVAEEATTEADMAAEEEEVEVAVVGEGTEHTLWELVLSVDFWLYFWVYLCGATLGLVYMNNLGQISQSRGVSDSVLLSISSSFGFFGKLASAPVSAFARSKYMVSRPASMALLMAPMAGSFFLLLNPTMLWLFISTAIIGMCSGAMTSIAVSVTAELFGNKHFSVNHNILIANIPIGSFLFGCMSGYIYDKEEGKEHATHTCVGVECYHKTFVLWGMICFAGTILSFLLYCRTRRRSSKLSSQV